MVEASLASAWKGALRGFFVLQVMRSVLFALSRRQAGACGYLPGLHVPWWKRIVNRFLVRYFPKCRLLPVVVPDPLPDPLPEPPAHSGPVNFCVTRMPVDNRLFSEINRVLNMDIDDAQKFWHNHQDHEPPAPVPEPPPAPGEGLDLPSHLRW
jgi:hypothetical protein